jgi:type IV pilus biogenesis protein CpaD/CtpE
MKSISLTVLGLALLGSGCFSRAHLTDNYARAYKTAFARQVANPGAAATAKTPKGLDALEAGLVVDTYRAQLAPRGGGSENQQMILLNPQAGSLGYTPSTPPPAK